MRPPIELGNRRTSVQSIFEFLRDEIVNLRLLPGTKISEAEVARQFGVSRQPVRDAFTRLENIDLLLIRPQKATEVRLFSTEDITRARFIRSALEVEVLRRAAKMWDEKDKARLDAIIKQQEAAIEAKNSRKFNKLDHEFHETLCRVGRAEFVISAIEENKSKVARLCRLSLATDDESQELQRLRDVLRDHKEILERLYARDPEGAAAVGKRHLSRLDDTIKALRESHSHFFED